MFSEAVRKSLAKRRDDSMRLYDDSRGFILPINGHLETLALVPTNLVGREMYPAEKFYTVVVQKIFPDMEDYSVVFDEITDEEIPEIMYSMSMLAQLMKPEAIGLYFEGAAMILRTFACEDHEIVSVFRDDVIVQLGIERMGRMMPIDVFVGILTLVYDVMYYRGLTRKIEKSLIPEGEARVRRMNRPMDFAPQLTN